MQKSQFREARTIGIVKEHEAGVEVGEPCRLHGISRVTLYRWKQQYAGLEVSEAHRLRQLEEENARLKRLVVVAAQALDNQMLKELLRKNF
jgi:putative transposase